MTPETLTAFMARQSLNKKETAEALGIARTTLDGYLSGRHPIPRLVALGCAALSMGLPEHP